MSYVESPWPPMYKGTILVLGYSYIRGEYPWVPIGIRGVPLGNGEYINSTQ